MVALPYTSERTTARDVEPPAPPSFVGRTLQAVRESPTPTRWQRLRVDASRRWTAFKDVAPTLTGFGLLTGAAFQLGTTAGLVAAGLSVFAAEWKVKG